MRKWITVVLIALPLPVLAGSWCLSRDAQQNCSFTTAEQCYAVSVRGGGSCAPNPRRLGEAGQSRYCVLTSTFRDCSYRSQRRCLAAALENNGGCVRNVQRDLERGARGRRSTGNEPEFDFDESIIPPGVN